MNKFIGTAMLATGLLVQMQLRAQSEDLAVTQSPQLQPAIPATRDPGLRGQIGGQTTAQSPMPFTTTSPYSYSEPAGTNYEVRPAVTNSSPLPTSLPSPSASIPLNSGNSSAATSSKTSSRMQKKHGFSPVGAVFGVPDRAVKSSLGLTDRTAKTSLGLTDRTAKTSLGITGKTTKELFKAIF